MMFDEGAKHDCAPCKPQCTVSRLKKMPVYHLLLTNHNPGNILYSYYFQEKEKHYPDQLVYEQLLQQSVYRTAAVKPTRSTITLLEDRYVVFQRVGEIIIYLTGVNETDEIIRK